MRKGTTSVMTKFRAILLILAVCFLTFGPTLKNEFIGDSKALFVGNDFYKSPANLARLFKKDFITDLSRFDNTGPFSGCVSYRPVTALTFFWDYALWKENPFGHNLTNVLLHALASGLVFILIGLLGSGSPVALLAALLFAAHPVQAEAVNVVGYRSDLLATVAYLFAFIFYIRFIRADSPRDRPALGLSYLFFFLAVFSKENAVTLPFVLFLCDYWFLNDRPFSHFIFKRSKYYVGFFSILIFYLLVYVFVFPSAFYPKMPLLGQTRVEHFIYIAQIFLLYLKALLWPFGVRPLPPLYLPALSSLGWLEGLLGMTVVILFLISSSALFSRQRTVAFAALWFLANYLPVSNILPLLNPYAYRMLYLPSVGFFWLLALLIDNVAGRLQTRADTPVKAFAGALIAVLLVSTTLRLNHYFRNDVTACRAMIHFYPDSSRPYWVLGHHFYMNGDYETAAGYLRQFLQNKKERNPFLSQAKQQFMGHHLLARAYMPIDPKKAIEELQVTIGIYDGEAVVFADLAKAYIAVKDYDNVLKNARRAYELNPRLGIAYVYAVHALVETGRLKEAFGELENAKAVFPNDPNIKIVEDYLNEKAKAAPP